MFAPGKLHWLATGRQWNINLLNTRRELMEALILLCRRWQSPSHTLPAQDDDPRFKSHLRLPPPLMTLWSSDILMIVLVLFSTFVLYTFDDQKHAGIFHQNSQATARLAAYLAPLHCTYFMVGEIECRVCTRKSTFLHWLVTGRQWATTLTIWMCKNIWVTSTILSSCQLHGCCVHDTLQTSRDASNLISKKERRSVSTTHIWNE